jgi:hypothetical protein
MGRCILVVASHADQGASGHATLALRLEGLQEVTSLACPEGPRPPHSAWGFVKFNVGAGVNPLEER